MSGEELARASYRRLIDCCPWMGAGELMMCGERLAEGQIVVTVDGVEAVVFLEGTLNANQDKEDT